MTTLLDQLADLPADNVTSAETVAVLADAIGVHPEELRVILAIVPKNGRTVSQQIGQAVAERALSA